MKRVFPLNVRVELSGKCHRLSVGSGCWQLRQGLDLGHDETALGVVRLPDRLQQGEGHFNCQPQTNT